MLFSPVGGLKGVHRRLKQKNGGVWDVIEQTVSPFMPPSERKSGRMF
jgi:hypothetical protein